MPRLELAKKLIEQVLAEEARAATQQRTQAQPQAGRLLTVQQAGEYIGRSESAVRHLIFDRDLPVVRAGRCVRIDRRDLDTWIENNKQ
jgi:excisionase family DNA binding protein